MTLFKRHAHRTPLLAFLLVLASCQSQYQQEEIDLVTLPKTWQTADDYNDESTRWSTIVESNELDALVAKALAHNFELQQAERDVAIAQTRVFSANMRYIPELDARFSANRQGTPLANDSTDISNQFSLSAELSYELNIWGQVSDAKRAAAFNYAATEANYAALRRDIVRRTAEAWANVIEYQQIVAMGTERLENLGKNLNIIESGYRSGLNSALEVYLARNDVEAERSSLVNARQLLSDARRDLTLLLGEYPDNQYLAQAQFPDAAAVIPPSTPSEILMRRPDLQTAWLNLLSQNSELAVAHKARFPSLRLTASTGQSSDDLSSLLDQGNPAWNIGASLIQPLLASGTLKAAEDTARLQLEQAELQYTQAVYQAFKEVESTLERQQTLEAQYAHTLQSRDNALIAEKLSFDQYLKGLVSYTTVLDAQNRALDAEVNLIGLKRQIFVNKIQLQQALAGELDFLNDTP